MAIIHYTPTLAFGAKTLSQNNYRFVWIILG